MVLSRRIVIALWTTAPFLRASTVSLFVTEDLGPEFPNTRERAIPASPSQSLSGCPRPLRVHTYPGGYK